MFKVNYGDYAEVGEYYQAEGKSNPDRREQPKI